MKIKNILAVVALTTVVLTSCKKDDVLPSKPSDGGNNEPITNVITEQNTEHLPVNLASAGDYVILAGSQVSNVPTSSITGNIGLSPAAGTFLTGFSLVLPPGGSESTS